MYTLRKLTTDGVEMNFELGSSYVVVKKENSVKEFERAFREIIIGNNNIFFSEQKDITGDLNDDNKNFWLDVPVALEKGFKYIHVENNTYFIKSETEVKSAFDNEVEDQIYAFVTSEGGKDVFPLYIRQKNFIMTDTGKTFSNLTLR